MLKTTIANSQAALAIDGSELRNPGSSRPIFMAVQHNAGTTKASGESMKDTNNRMIYPLLADLRAQSQIEIAATDLVDHNHVEKVSETKHQQNQPNAGGLINDELLYGVDRYIRLHS